jgi:hypothetical protein
MNLKRRFFRLWAVFAVAWLLGSVWVLRHDLRADCEHLFLHGELPEDWQNEAVCKSEVFLAERLRPPGLIDAQRNAIPWIVVPPLGLLVMGTAGFWFAYGFRSSRSN